MSRTVRIILLLLWAAFVFWQTLTPHPLPPPKWLRWDKLRHASAYALLTLFAGLAFAGGRLRTWACAALAAVAFGGLLEWGQRLFVRNRRFDFGDLLANAAGALLVLGVVYLATRIGRRSPPAIETPEPPC